jgi:hypothetical protein
MPRDYRGVQVHIPGIFVTPVANAPFTASSRYVGRVGLDIQKLRKVDFSGAGVSLFPRSRFYGHLPKTQIDLNMTMSALA